MFKLIWLLGWLRPRTALRRLAVVALVVMAVSGGTLGLKALAESAVDSVGRAVDDVVTAVTGVLPDSDGEAARVTHVVDGDTVDISTREDGRSRETRVRLVGVDTPESKKPGTPVECGALDAEHRLLELTFTAPRDTDGDGLFDAEGGTGRRVEFSQDSASDDVDRYGRSLGYLTLPGRERTLQEQMLAAGWADVYVYQGRDFDRLREFRAAARIARREDVGVYAKCDGDFHSSD